MASLGTLFFKGFSFFKKNSPFSLGKIETHWETSVFKLALNEKIDP
jgi:hypothetical protein